MQTQTKAKKIKQIIRSTAAFFLAAVLLCSMTPTALAAPTKSAAVVSAALGEVGYTEGSREYSKFGAWYGLPHSYWCDMFVSWCGKQAGIPASKFPHHCSCSAHVKLFNNLGVYQKSAARGGGYIPKQGDIIFFYNYLRYPSATTSNHTGIVLYAEDGYVYTIEGNALTNRLDYTYEELSDIGRDGDLEPPDYVTVNRYKLDAPNIHGYGAPSYDDRTPLDLEGFVDLGKQSERAELFQKICETGLMRPTSSHTFSPYHGMTRGDFLVSVAELFGLLGYDEETKAFDDVPLDSAYYSAVMSARSAGLVSGATENNFLPDKYISPSAAQAILTRVQEYVGLESKEFTFTLGDYSYLAGSYTIRSDIAQAFYELCQRMPLSEPYEGGILLDGEPVDWEARTLDGVCYVPLAILMPEPEEEDSEDSENFENPEDSEDETVEKAEKPEESETELEDPEGEISETETETETDEPLKTSVKQPVPLGATDRVVPVQIMLQNDGITVETAGFMYHGEQYIALPEAAAFLELNIEQTFDETEESEESENSEESADAEQDNEEKSE